MFPTGRLDLLDPELPALNRLPARVPLRAYESAEAAMGRSDRPNPWRLTLDGQWNFLLVDAPDRIPRAWYEDSARIARRWNPIEVPGCWTRQRVGDWPHYTNIVMPWPDLEAPATPTRNPTGLYHRSFRLPDEWCERDIVLHLGGFESVAVVWCNGRFVGMGKDSRLPSEFDITDLVQPGSNTVDVAVVRYSDATWIEDQDQWWHGGLHRTVFVEARSPRRIDDVGTVADYDAATGSGALSVAAHVCGEGALEVRVSLCDGDRTLASGQAQVPASPSGPPIEQLIGAYDYRGRVACVDLDIADVRPWSAEAPALYRVVAELFTAAGDFIEATAVDVGFRRIEVKDRRLLVNGQAVVLHGVNRHDHHPRTGKVQTIDDLRADLVSMRRHNINALRCSHYPNDHALLELCDELGMYVIDEANVESHARLRSLTNDTRYLGAILDRVKRMVQRDRNHASVIMWSLGNESGHGHVHDAAAAWVRAVDPHRPVHYEGAIQERFVVGDDTSATSCQAPSARERLVTDVVCPMYSPIATIIEWAQWAEATGLDDRPLILCEYSHAMGNSNGSIAEYVEAFHSEPALGGGFIWDWKDQGLYEVDDRGRVWWAYGGHYGDEPNDANFCINGLVGPDGQPHPGLREVAWAYRPVVTSQVRGRRVRIENRRNFASLADLACEWTLLVDGESVESGSLAVETEPGRATVLSVPIETRLDKRHEAHLRFVWKLGADTAWAPAGHVVAWDDVVLKSPAPSRSGPDDLPAPGPARSTGSVTVGDVELAWDENGITGIGFGGVATILGDIAPSLWRAPTDNDGVKQGWMSELKGMRPAWLAWGLDRLTAVVDRVEQVRLPDGARLVVLHRRFRGAAEEALAVSRFLVDRHSVRVMESLDVPSTWVDLPHVGSRFTVVGDIDRLSWFGLGPHETYSDRRSSGLVGRFTTAVADEYHPFVVPQEHGAHQQTRWFSLSDGRRSGIHVSGTEPFSFSARFHHDAALAAATTLADLEVSETIEVHVDAAVRGLGTGACGPDTLPGYRVAPGPWSWDFTIEGLPR